jgi:hypothetical protein
MNERGRDEHGFMRFPRYPGYLEKVIRDGGHEKQLCDFAFSTIFECDVILATS